MTYEDFYAEAYPLLMETEHRLRLLAEAAEPEAATEDDLKKIVYITSRIKHPDSMLCKLKNRGLPQTKEAALTMVHDAVGLRIVCAFAEDVLDIAAQLRLLPELEILREKDYMRNPKPNGYRSYHILVRMKENGVLAEIQIRTIAMDFWATLEHQLKYKKNIEDSELIRRELKRCADEIASTDLSMQTIREIIRDNQNQTD